MTPGDVIGNTRAMTAIPRPTRYSRALGWHAPAMRRTVIVGSIGLIVAVVLLWLLTVVLSWTVVNTVFTLRYADQTFGSEDAGIAFGDADRPEGPTYREFAYVAFTIGMCYQVSDTTVRDHRIRRTVLSHALLSYAFGAAIVGGSVNLIAGLIQ